MAFRLRTVVTMVALTGFVIWAAYFGWTGLTRGWFSSESEAVSKEPATPCSAPPPVTLRAHEVRVSVYNAGAPGGQATALMTALTEQGFLRGTLADAPDPIDVGGIAIRPGKSKQGATRLVERQFKKSRVADDRKPYGPGVNVLIGREFTGLAPDAPLTIPVAQKKICHRVG